jgi:F420-dependent oxidoreductase-like protein
MKLGIHFVNFTLPGGPEALGPTLGAAAQAAEEGGCAKLTLMDHWFQMERFATAQDPMLEGYTGLGFVAGRTERITLSTLVTGVTYRHPGLLAKIVTTLDVVSGGRAQLGIGAAWYEREHRGLGVPFPPLAERFERLEETLQICQQMWSDDDGPYEGRHYRLAETICRPHPVQQPRPRILVGGSGERKTLRLVAQYADICNLFAGPELARKLDVLRQHCADVGRDYDDIEKTVMSHLDIGPDGEKADDVLAQLQDFTDLGVQHVHTRLPLAHGVRQIELFAEKIIPQAAGLREQRPAGTVTSTPDAGG